MTRQRLLVAFPLIVAAVVLITLGAAVLVTLGEQAAFAGWCTLVAGLWAWWLARLTLTTKEDPAR